MEIELLERIIRVLEQISVMLSIITMANIYIAIFITVIWGNEEDK